MSHFSLDLLAVGAHPDDIEFTCSGLMVLLAKRGYRTGVVDLTQAELSTRGDVHTRALETEAASRAMGLVVRENLNLPDGWINPYSHYDDPPPVRTEQSHLVKVVSALRRNRPEILLLPYEFDKHPDHEATSELLTKAVFLSGLKRFVTPDGADPFTPKQVIYFQLRYSFHPTFIVDITEVIEEKNKVIACFPSQHPPIPDPAHPVVQPALSALATRDRYYGAMIGTEYAEPFFARNVLGLRDPIAFFRENPFCKPNFYPPR